MARRRNRFRHDAGGSAHRVRVNVRMRSNWRNSHEEGSVTFQGLIQEAQSLLGDHIGRVMTSVVFGGVAIALVGGVVVGVGVRVEKEVGAVEALGKRLIVGAEAVGVHELSGVIGVVAGILEPHGEPIVIESLRNELGIPAYSQLVSPSRRWDE